MCRGPCFHTKVRFSYSNIGQPEKQDKLNIGILFVRSSNIRKLFIDAKEM